ncbi:MAG: helix-turn-helix transcriptional regulator [Patescibacteria group bacterium]
MPSKITPEEAEVYRKIGKRIQSIRNEKKMTQERVAEATGLAAKYIGFIEQGRKRPRIHILISIAKALNTSIKDFF